nr:eukaryotic peptide chain release factor subunit 1-3 [Tanacetum cinerariifolium]
MEDEQTYKRAGVCKRQWNKHGNGALFGTLSGNSKEQESDKSNFMDRETNAELEVEEKMSLLDWFVNEYKKFGCTLEFVKNKSELGSQFCRGIGTIGGILRYQVDFCSFDEPSDNDHNDAEDDYDDAASYDSD